MARRGHSNWHPADSEHPRAFDPLSYSMQRQNSITEILYLAASSPKVLSVTSLWCRKLLQAYSSAHAPLFFLPPPGLQHAYSNTLTISHRSLTLLAAFIVNFELKRGAGTLFHSPCIHIWASRIYRICGRLDGFYHHIALSEAKGCSVWREEILVTLYVHL